MKNRFTLLLLILIPVVLNAQSFYQYGRKHKDKYHNGNFTTDIHGHLHYQNKEFKATLKTDIFDNKIYKDSRNNEATYSKDLWQDAFAGHKENERRIMYRLIGSFRGMENTKEKFKRTVTGNIEYTCNNFRATLSKSIFDEGVYKDNRGNELKYSKEFWSDILNDFENSEIEILYWMQDQCRDKKNYRAEFKVDILDRLQYKNSNREQASFSKDIFDKMKYEDSAGNKIEFSPERWNKILERYGSKTRIFMSLLSEYLRFDE